MAKRPNTFRAWVTEISVKEIAYHLQVTDGCVRHWRRGFSLPRPHQMHQLIKLSKGRISYASIIEPYLEKQGWIA